MQTVSNRWKSLHRAEDGTVPPITAEAMVEITLESVNYDVQGTVDVSQQGAEYTKTSSAALDSSRAAPVATLEPDLWRLDGTFPIKPTDEQVNNGFASSVLSGTDGTFASDVVFTILKNTMEPAGTGPWEKLPVGITLTWGETCREYPVNFTVDALLDGTVISHNEITDNTSDISSVTFARPTSGQEFDEVQVTVTKWCRADRRARIERFYFGVNDVITKNDEQGRLISYTHILSADPVSGSLPKSEINFELDNTDGTYDLDNPNNPLIYQQRITARYGYKYEDGTEEWIKGGIFYLSEWKSPQTGTTSTLTAKGLFNCLASDIALGNTTVGAYLNSVSIAGLFNPKYSMRVIYPSSAFNIPTKSPGETEGAQETAQMAANAGCYALWIDRDDAVHAEPWYSRPDPDYLIDDYNSYNPTTEELTKELKEVVVNQGTPIPVQETGETQQVDNPLIANAEELTVGEWLAEYLGHRKIMSGEFRSDPRLDVMDIVTVMGKRTNNKVIITELTYTYNGEFRAKFKGRAVESVNMDGTGH